MLDDHVAFVGDRFRSGLAAVGGDAKGFIPDGAPRKAGEGRAEFGDEFEIGRIEVRDRARNRWARRDQFDWSGMGCRGDAWKGILDPVRRLAWRLGDPHEKSQFIRPPRGGIDGEIRERDKGQGGERRNRNGRDDKAAAIARSL